MDIEIRNLPKPARKSKKQKKLKEVFSGIIQDAVRTKNKITGQGKYLPRKEVD